MVSEGRRQPIHQPLMPKGPGSSGLKGPADQGKHSERRARGGTDIMGGCM